MTICSGRSTEFVWKPPSFSYTHAIDLFVFQREMHSQPLQSPVSTSFATRPCRAQGRRSDEGRDVTVQVQTACLNMQRCTV